MISFVLYSEKRGYYVGVHNHTIEARYAQNFEYLDKALELRDYLSRRYGEEYHIKARYIIP